MSNTNNTHYKYRHWITENLARNLVEPYIDLDVWDIDLFSICRLLDTFYPDTLFFLVDDIKDERVEVIK